jgi:hypothetical protein
VGGVITYLTRAKLSASFLLISHFFQGEEDIIYAYIHNDTSSKLMTAMDIECGGFTFISNFDSGNLARVELVSKKQNGKMFYLV